LYTMMADIVSDIPQVLTAAWLALTHTAEDDSELAELLLFLF